MITAQITEDSNVSFVEFKDAFAPEGGNKKLKLNPENLEVCKDTVKKIRQVLAAAVGNEIVDYAAQFKGETEQPVLSQEEQLREQKHHEILEDVKEMVEIIPIDGDFLRRTHRAIDATYALERALSVDESIIEQWSQQVLNTAKVRKAMEIDKLFGIDEIKNPTPVQMQAAINMVEDAFDEVLEKAREQKIPEQDVNDLIDTHIKDPSPKNSHKDYYESPEFAHKIEEQVNGEGNYHPIVEPAPVDFTETHVDTIPVEEEPIHSQPKEEVSKDENLDVDVIEKLDNDLSQDPEIAKLLESIHAAKEEKERLNQENQSLNASFKTATEEKNTAEQDAQDSREEVTRTQQEEQAKIEKARKEAKEKVLLSLKEQIANQQREVSSMKEKNAQLEEGINRMKDETDAYRKEIHSNNQQVAQIKMSTTKILDELANYTGQLATLQGTMTPAASMNQSVKRGK